MLRNKSNCTDRKTIRNKSVSFITLQKAKRIYRNSSQCKYQNLPIVSNISQLPSSQNSNCPVPAIKRTLSAYEKSNKHESIVPKVLATTSGKKYPLGKKLNQPTLSCWDKNGKLIQINPNQIKKADAEPSLKKYKNQITTEKREIGKYKLRVRSKIGNRQISDVRASFCDDFKQNFNTSKQDIINKEINMKNKANTKRVLQCKIIKCSKIPFPLGSFHKQKSYSKKTTLKLGDSRQSTESCDQFVEGEIKNERKLNKYQNRLEEILQNMSISEIGFEGEAPPTLTSIDNDILVL